MADGRIKSDTFALIPGYPSLVTIKLSISLAAFIQWVALAVSWYGLQTFTQANFIFPSSISLWIFMICWWPFGLIVPSGTFHAFSVISLCFGFSFIISAGSLCVNVPTSLAVPQALGWPVKLNAPLPGFACLFSKKWTL